MANVNIVTTPRQDKAVKAKADIYNLTHPPLTPVNYAKMVIEDMLDGWADEFERSENLRLFAKAFQRAPVAEQNNIKAILLPYMDP